MCLGLKMEGIIAHPSLTTILNNGPSTVIIRPLRPLDGNITKSAITLSSSCKRRYVIENRNGLTSSLKEVATERAELEQKMKFELQKKDEAMNGLLKKLEEEKKKLKILVEVLLIRSKGGNEMKRKLYSNEKNYSNSKEEEDNNDDSKLEKQRYHKCLNEMCRDIVEKCSEVDETYYIDHVRSIGSVFGNKDVDTYIKNAITRKRVLKAKDKDRRERGIKKRVSRRNKEKERCEKAIKKGLDKKKQQKNNSNCSSSSDSLNTSSNDDEFGIDSYLMDDDKCYYPVICDLIEDYDNIDIDNDIIDNILL